jgi:hypothetical protein
MNPTVLQTSILSTPVFFSLDPATATPSASYAFNNGHSPFVSVVLQMIGTGTISGIIDVEVSLDNLIWVTATQDTYLRSYLSSASGIAIASISLASPWLYIRVRSSSLVGTITSLSVQTLG